MTLVGEHNKKHKINNEPNNDCVSLAHQQGIRVPSETKSFHHNYIPWDRLMGKKQTWRTTVANGEACMVIVSTMQMRPRCRTLVWSFERKWTTYIYKEQARTAAYTTAFTSFPWRK